MKQFFKFMFASMLGVFLSFFLVFLLMLGIIGSLATLGKQEPKDVAANSILHLKFDGEIRDRGNDDPMSSFDFMTFTPTQTKGLNDILRNIEKAKLDANIEGILLEVTFMQTNWATIGEIREALLDFKESGKFIVAYSDVMMQNAYYLSTVADEIYINPEGMLDFRGLNAEVMFFKNMLEKVGVDIQVIRAGKYKSAGEPFFLEKLSNENRIQILEYISSIWNNVSRDIAEERNLSLNQINEIADEFQSRTPELAIEAGLIDGVLYRDELTDLLKGKLALEEKKELSLVRYNRYMNVPTPDSMLPIGAREKIALIYGEGTIVSGKGTDQNMADETIAEAIRKARKDTTVKAIVFRVNSPGGSALASENMLREAILAGEEKPFVVSMGNLAASGGYYVACYADKIVANSNTITGSIGVFGMIPNMGEMFNDKLGITFDNVKTNEFADFPSVSRPLSRVEMRMMQENVDNVYETFLNHVAEGRGLPVASVDSIAQGRVWSGTDAKRIGLVDEIGGLKRALEIAAELAELESYRLVEYPERKEFFERLLEGFENVETRIMKARLGDAYDVYQRAKAATESTGILMRMPYDVDLN